jgi:soluble lytic murein transglycosylase
MVFVRALPILILLFCGQGIPDGISAQNSQSSQYTDPAKKKSVVEVSRKEIEVGRYWHASRILRDFQQDQAVFDTELTLLLAEADAGWANWADVVNGLQGKVFPQEESLKVRWLLARGFEQLENWSSAYEQYIGLVAQDVEKRNVALARAARLAFRRDHPGQGLESLSDLLELDSNLASWTALEIVQKPGNLRDVDLVSSLLPLVRNDSTTAEIAWDLEPKSWSAYGDVSEALKSYSGLLDQELTLKQRGEVLGAVASLKMQLGDSLGAQTAYRESFEVYPKGPTAAEAAWALRELEEVEKDWILDWAEVLEDQREYHRALMAYDRYVLLAPDSVRDNPEVQMTRAGLLWRTGRFEDSVTLFRKLVETDDEDLELAVLEEWLLARRNQGNASAVRTIEGWITERFPQSRQATDLTASRGHFAYSRSDYGTAINYYNTIQSAGTSHASAGLSRMRLGQIYLEEQNYLKASEVFGLYLKEFPNGRRWEEATYWLSRSLLKLDRDDEALDKMRYLSRRNPLSYYGALAFELLEQPYDPQIPDGPDIKIVNWLVPLLASLDRFQLAGLELATEKAIDDLIVSVENDVDASIILAENLIKRGFTIEGINLGWKLLGNEVVMSRRLAKIIYPFPYREIVYREATEYSVDPILLAALIRQESAFTPAIRSSAGAIGLMQVMPTTGREVARGAGIDGFTPLSLETPEINLHLGTRYLLAMEDRYGETGLPLVLSAYNAGPTRASRWRNFSEAKDILRFTERIPFEETRGYVKNVVRNIHIYKFLYEFEARGAH